MLEIVSHKKGDYMQYDTAQLQKVLNLTDDSAVVTDITESDDVLTVSIRKSDTGHFCRTCTEHINPKEPGSIL